MRHNDDDLAKFRDDPVVQALNGPASANELSGEAAAVAAYREAVSHAVPPQKTGRSVARLATGTTVGVLVLAVSGGAAAAYTNNLPDQWQEKLHDKISSIPAPKESTPKPPVALHTPTPAPVATQPIAPTPVHTGGKPTTSPSPSATVATPSPTASLPVAVPTPTPTPTTSAAPTVTPSPTASATPPPPPGAQLQMHVARRVTAGTAVTVTGRLIDKDGNEIANRRVVLVERVVGEPGRHRVGSSTTSETGEVSIAAPAVQRNVRLFLRSGRVHSTPQRVVVVPILHVEVPATAAGATAVTVTVTASGAQAGDVVFIRGAGSRDGRRATLDSSLRATFTIPVSQSQALHYRAVIQQTKAHAGHGLAFYVPASGG